jgi:hypothetical protein
MVAAAAAAHAGPVATAIIAQTALERRWDGAGEERSRPQAHPIRVKARVLHAV